MKHSCFQSVTYRSMAQSMDVPSDSLIKKKLDRWKLDAGVMCGSRVLCGGCACQLYAQTAWLDELDVSAAAKGYSVPMKYETIVGKVLAIVGKTYVRDLW